MVALTKLYSKSHEDLVSWLSTEYALGQGVALGNAHRVRRQNIGERLELYRDKPQRTVRDLINRIYTTTEMQTELLPYIDIAREQNVSKRIVNEVASLYDRPALRRLKDRDADFHLEERRLSLHFIHQEAHRLTNLCNEVLVWQFIGIDDKTALRIVTPDRFDAVPDPRDKMQSAGYIFDSAPFAPASPEIAKSLPNYEIWDDTYRYLVNSFGKIVNASGEPSEPIEHGLKRIPGVLFHRREPTTCILDGDHGEDIKSAHWGVALLNVMIMRLSKVQGERQPVLQGNLAAMAQNQVANGERPLVLPPGVVASMLEMKTDPDHYLMVKKDKIASVAQSYGISYEQFSLNETDAAQSGKAYTVRREKLIELRVEQRARAKKHEALVVELMGFDPTGMKVNFQEQALPLDAMEAINLLDAKMSKGLDSPIAYLQREDPDLERDDAIADFKQNLADYSYWISMIRALNIPQVPGNSSAPAGSTPQQNGAAGGHAKADTAATGDSASSTSSGGDTSTAA